MQALTINRKIHLENTFGDVAREKWSVAIADSRGYYYHADPQFKELVRSEWRDSADDVLASALLHALTGGDRRVVGRKVVVKSRLEHGLWYLRVRQREKVDSLTPRELQVARLLLSGLSRKEVANSLHRTEATIQTQTRSIYSKLGIQSVVLLAKHLALAE
jgi:DNA-binding CsgD family transcriptional regulator